MSFEQVFTKATKRLPAKPTDYEAEVNHNESITIRNAANNLKNTFKIGDMAEYDSYNLSYYGPIVGITKKSVTIVDRFDYDQYKAGGKIKKYRLDLERFCWRNIKFNLAKTQEENATTSQYI